MSKIKNDRLLKALAREPVDKTPIWVMRQAGRYLPEYREVRKHAGDFMSLCKNPELAKVVTMQPLQRFDLDAAILFSDILTIPDAMGLGLRFAPGEGPYFTNPLRTERDIKQLKVPDPTIDLDYVLAAISKIKTELNSRIPLLGFSGSPWTLACYMVEGHGSKQFHEIKSLMYRDPDTLHYLLLTLTQAVTEYLQAQLDTGVDAVMIFDTWGGLLTTPGYANFSLQYMAKIINKLNTDKPVIIFTKNGGLWLEQIAATGCAALGLDWTIELDVARARVGEKVALQGNLDPAIMLSTPAIIRDEVARILELYGKGSGHIFNLGHGITPDVPPENMAALVDAVHELSPAYHVV